MWSDSHAKVAKAREVAEMKYAQFSERCDDYPENIGLNIKTTTSEVESVEANLAVEVATTTSQIIRERSWSQTVQATRHT